MNKKYELLRDQRIVVAGRTLFRIRAKISFADVKAGDIGGYIEKEENLATIGDSWVYDNALVFQKARVFGNATVSGKAWVHTRAQVSGNARVCDNARVHGYASVTDHALVTGDARVCDNAQVSGHAQVSGRAFVAANALVCGDAEVSDIRVYGDI